MRTYDRSNIASACNPVFKLISKLEQAVSVDFARLRRVFCRQDQHRLKHRRAKNIQILFSKERK